MLTFFFFLHTSAALTDVSLLAAFNGGCEGYAVRFDGTNWLDAGHGAWSQPKDYTLEFWIKPYLTQPNSLAVLGNFLRMGAFPHRPQCGIATRLVFLFCRPLQLCLRVPGVS
jgi:hypothetical protein